MNGKTNVEEKYEIIHKQVINEMFENSKQTYKCDMNSINGKKIRDIYAKQVAFQCIVTNDGHVPRDDVEDFKYHCLAMIEELGELLTSDKRWKTHRNVRHIVEEKNKEIADIFITALNIALFSGLDLEMLLNTVMLKQNENLCRLKNE